jgi:hypothetical protein
MFQRILWGNVQAFELSHLSCVGGFNAKCGLMVRSEGEKMLEISMIFPSIRCIFGLQVLQQSVRVESDRRNATPHQTNCAKHPLTLSSSRMKFGAAKLRHPTQARTEASRMGRMSATATR